jgi:CheY-like chemotaxis protein
MPDGGRLRIAVRGTDEHAELEVADTGVGMSAETRERIFEPFFTTKPVGQGTGLGLSTVDGIVGQLGGTVDVASRLGAGTAFTIRLPRVFDEVAVQSAGSRRPADGDGDVLLVEDEEIVRRVTTAMLRSLGYEVTAVATAEDALTLLAGGVRPDVLVSDVVMTGMDGPTLVDEAREIVPDLAVLFVSGYPAEMLRDRTDETVLTKPFTPTELADRIERVRRTAVPA